jgi:hypothetical protein
MLDGVEDRRAARGDRDHQREVQVEPELGPSWDRSAVRDEVEVDPPQTDGDHHPQQADHDALGFEGMDVGHAGHRPHDDLAEDDDDEQPHPFDQ